MRCPRLVREPMGETVRLVTALTLFLSMVSHCPAADSLPVLTIPDGFGVNIPFTGAPQDLDLIRDGGFRVIRMDFTWSNINWDKKRLSDEQQARYLARMFLINLGPKVPISIWYDWKNDGADPNEREHHFGTMSRDLQPKAAYLAAKSLASTLAGYSITQRLDLPSERDFVLRLVQGTHQALALWTTAEEHEVTIPLENTQGTVVDLLGQRKNISWPSGLLKLTISDSPQYLLLAD